VWKITDLPQVKGNLYHVQPGVYQGVLGMVLLVPFWDIFNRQVSHMGIKIRG